MATKAGKSISDENLEKASGGLVMTDYEKDVDLGVCRNPYYRPVYIVRDNRTNKLVKKFHNKKEAEEFDKKYNNKENNN